MPLEDLPEQIDKQAVFQSHAGARQNHQRRDAADEVDPASIDCTDDAEDIEELELQEGRQYGQLRRDDEG